MLKPSIEKLISGRTYIRTYIIEGTRNLNAYIIEETNFFMDAEGAYESNCFDY